MFTHGLKLKYKLRIACCYFIILLILLEWISISFSFAAILLLSLIESFKNDGFNAATLLLTSLFFLFPLFAFAFFINYKPKKPGGLPLDSSIARQLYNLIDDCAKKVGITCGIDNIILTPGISVSVYYNPNIHNFFNDSKAELYVGVALCRFLSKDELSAVIAHEFAHLSQPQTQYKGYLARVSNTAIILGRNGEFGSNGDLKPGSVGISPINPARFICYLFNYIFDLVFDVVFSSYNTVSIKMELEADMKSASIYGSNNMLSALNKSIAITRRLALYKSLILPYLSSLGYRCDGFWKTFEASSPLFNAIDDLDISDNRLLLDLKQEQMVYMEPNLLLRLESLKKEVVSINENEVNKQSIQLIPNEIVEKMDMFLCRKCGQGDGILIGKDKYSEIIDNMRNGLFSDVNSMDEAFLIVNDLLDDIRANEFGVIQTVYPEYVQPSYDMIPQPGFWQATEQIYSTRADTCPVCGYKVIESTKVCPHCHEVIAE